MHLARWEPGRIREGRVGRWAGHLAPARQVRAWHSPGATSRVFVRLSRPCACGVTVTAEPDVSSMPLRPDDEFVVIASDGIFDVFDNDQVRGLPRTRRTSRA